MELDLILRFDDRAVLRHEVYPDGAPELGSGVGAVDVSVAAARNATDVAAVAARSARLEVDAVFATREVPDDLDDRLTAVLEEMLGEARPTPAQIEKVARFTRHPKHDLAVEVARQYCQAVSDVLPRSSIGTAWGVTVMPDNGLVE